MSTAGGSQPRSEWAHKGEGGYVLVAAGSRTYSGSPVFNAMGALRGGADIAAIVGERRAMDIAATFAPDIITTALDVVWDDAAVDFLTDYAKKFQALIIGCGMARDEKTYAAIRAVIARSNLPMVVDAEAIRAVADKPDILHGKPIVLTPHAEEFRVLTGESVLPEVHDRKEKMEKWADKLGVTILLKGHVDVISDGGEVLLNETGSPFMTKGGFGDVLSGICGAFLARGVSPLHAAYQAARVNGLAGEVACKKFGAGVVASDIFPFIPAAVPK